MACQIHPPATTVNTNLEHYPLSEGICHRGRAQYKLPRAKFFVRAERAPVIAGRCPLSRSCQVLLVSPDPLQCAECEEILARLELQSVCCASLTDARARIEEQAFPFILCSDDLPDCNLRTAVRVLAAATGGVPVIVLSRLADWDAYMRALGAGAFDYIACPPEAAESERILRLALEQNPPPRRASRTAA